MSFSQRTRELRPRTEGALAVRSICPYCAVGCAQLVHVRGGKIVNIEGDPDSFISEGTLCPKGAATMQLVTGSHRQQRVLYRRPRSTRWESLPLERAMDMVARRIKDSRDIGWDEQHGRCMNIAHLGGATLDNEENYLTKKLLTGGLGIVQVENQARV
jgi:formate dehydrogenase major subunit